MPMYSLLEYRSNCSGTTSSSRIYSKDEATNFNAYIEDTNNFIFFSYKAHLQMKQMRSQKENSNRAIKVSLGNFWVSLTMPLINFKVELKLKLMKHCVFASNGTEASKTLATS